MREFIDNHRDQINEGVRAALLTLDGSKSATVGLMTGVRPQCCSWNPAIGSQQLASSRIRCTIRN